MNIVLTGFMASGKTEISKAIAKISKYKCIDTDDLITEKSGMTINDIFEKYGEKYFRNLEKETVKYASTLDNVIISTGGGVVLDKDNINNLRQNGLIFNLSPNFSVIESRLTNASSTRPLLKNSEVSEVKKRFNDRLPFYADCDFTIKVVNDRTPKSYALEILEIFGNNKEKEEQL